MFKPSITDVVTQHGHTAMPLGTTRILVVDDNEDTMTSLGMLLSEGGFDVRTACNGFAAVDIAESFSPRVVISDICMPDMNGFEVARRVRLSLGSSVYLIALTANSQAQFRERAQIVGFNKFMVKPVEFDELRELIESVVTSQEDEL